MFISRHYAAKPWTTLERRSILARAMNQQSPYLLPVRLDDTSLAGVRSTISYLNGARIGAAGVGSAIIEKLGSRKLEGKKFSGYVPRTEEDVLTLLGERPPAWEYLLFFYGLVKAVEDRNDAYLDYATGFAKPGEYIPDDEIRQVIAREYAVMNALIRNVDNLLSRESQDGAMGEPGEPGDVGRITHLSQRYGALFEDFIAWSLRLRGYTTESDEGHDLLAALGSYADQPIRRLHDFVFETRDIGDALHARLLAGEDVRLTLDLPFELLPESQARFDSALAAFNRHTGGNAKWRRDSTTP